MGLRAGGSRRVSGSREIRGAEDPQQPLPGGGSASLWQGPSRAIQRPLRMEEDPAASLAGRSERGEGTRGGGSSKVFHGEGGTRRWGVGKPDSLCASLARGIRGQRGGSPRALSVSSAGIRQRLQAGGVRREPRAGGEEPGRPNPRGKAGSEGGRGGSVSPGGFSSSSGRVGQSAGLAVAGGPQRLSPSLPLALASSAHRQAVSGSVLPGRSPAPPRCRRRRYRQGRRRRPQEQSCCHRGHFVAD